MRQLVLKLWVWLGWAPHQASDTVAHTEYQLIWQTFSRQGRSIRGKTYFLSSTYVVPLISLGRSKSHGRAENQGSDKKTHLFAKLQNNGHGSREGWRMGVGDLRPPQELCSLLKVQLQGSSCLLASVSCLPIWHSIMMCCNLCSHLPIMLFLLFTTECLPKLLQEP